MHCDSQKIDEVLRGGVCGSSQARQQLKEMVWIKSSENMVLEAMYRLSGLHEALEDLLRVQAPPASSAHAKDKAPVMYPTSPTHLHGSASGSGQGGSSGSSRSLLQAAEPSYSEAGPSNPDAAGVYT